MFYHLPDEIEEAEIVTINTYFYNGGGIPYTINIQFPSVEDSLSVGPITEELPIVQPGAVTVKTFPLKGVKKDCFAHITVAANIDPLFGKSPSFFVERADITRVI